MRVLAVLLVCVAGCRGAADAIHHAGGSDPVLCYKPKGFLQACRDGRGVLWICDDQSPVECMRVDEPAKIFAVQAVTPEHAP